MSYRKSCTTFSAFRQLQQSKTGQNSLETVEDGFEVSEEFDHLRALDAAGVDLEIEPPEGQAADEGKTFPVEGFLQHRGLLARSPSAHSGRAAQRARIILACAQGINNGQVGDALRVSAPTVGKWRARYIAHRPREPGRRSPQRRAPANHRPPGRSGDHKDFGTKARSGHPMEHPADGSGSRAFP